MKAFVPLLLAVAAACLVLPPAACAARYPDLVQTDAAMNRDIMDQGNDIHAMRLFMADVDIAYIGRVNGFTNLHELAKQAPTLTNPEYVQTLQTRYAAVSAAGDLGVTYGVWDTADIGDAIDQAPATFYRGFVFGLRAGLWTAKWSPRGAPRRYYFRYLRVWQRQGPGGVWRLVAGPFGARSNDLAISREVLPAGVAVEPLPSMRQAGHEAIAVQAATEVETAFPEALKKYGMRSAYGRFAADDIRVLYEDHPDVLNLAEFLQANNEPDLKLDLAPAGSLTAVSGDLRCDYGFAYRYSDGKRSQRFVYTNIWQYRADGWKLLFSYLRPLYD